MHRWYQYLVVFWPPRAHFKRAQRCCYRQRQWWPDGARATETARLYVAVVVEGVCARGGTTHVRRMLRDRERDRGRVFLYMNVGAASTRARATLTENEANADLRDRRECKEETTIELPTRFTHDDCTFASCLTPCCRTRTLWNACRPAFPMWRFLSDRKRHIGCRQLLRPYRYNRLQSHDDRSISNDRENGTQQPTTFGLKICRPTVS